MLTKKYCHAKPFKEKRSVTEKDFMGEMKAELGFER